MCAAMVSVAVVLGAARTESLLLAGASEGKEQPVALKSCLLWKNGKSENLRLDPKQVKDLVSLVEQYLRQTDDELNQAVTKTTLDKIRSATALEILFDAPLSFYVGRKKKDLQLDRVMVPLDGRAVVIYHGLKNYSNGPVVFHKGELQLLQKMIDSIKDSHTKPGPEAPSK
jgi:hypothetical protein